MNAEKWIAAVEPSHHQRSTMICCDKIHIFQIHHFSPNMIELSLSLSLHSHMQKYNIFNSRSKLTLSAVSSMSTCISTFLITYNNTLIVLYMDFTACYSTHRSLWLHKMQFLLALANFLGVALTLTQHLPVMQDYFPCDAHRVFLWIKFDFSLVVPFHPWWHPSL